MKTITQRDSYSCLKTHAYRNATPVDEITKDNCGFIYPLEKQPLHLPNGNKTRNFAIVSLDDNMEIGNAVKKNYKIVSNEAMFNTIQEAISGTDHKIVACGTFASRSKVFASIKVSDDFVAANRLTQNVLNVLWGHGGVFRVSARSSFTVVACANVFSRTLSKDGDFALNFRHVGEVDLKLIDFGKAIDLHYGVTAEFKAAMDSFESQSVAKDNAQSIFAGFIVRELPEKNILPTRTENTINELQKLFVSGNGNRGETMADVFNAFTDYYTHSSSGGENVWRQRESSEFGSGRIKKNEAFDLLSGKNVDSIGDLETVIKRGEKVLQLL